VKYVSDRRDFTARVLHCHGGISAIGKGKAAQTETLSFLVMDMAKTAHILAKNLYIKSTRKWDTFILSLVEYKM